jgi:hypothetical protein
MYLQLSSEVLDNMLNPGETTNLVASWRTSLVVRLDCKIAMRPQLVEIVENAIEYTVAGAKGPEEIVAAIHTESLANAADFVCALGPDWTASVRGGHEHNYLRLFNDALSLRSSDRSDCSKALNSVSGSMSWLVSDVCPTSLMMIPPKE